MASSSKVRQYIAYWLQLGKKILIGNGAAVRVPNQVIKGESYSREFEQFWQKVRSPESGDCYLRGTQETIRELLTPGWDIVTCARCPMLKPLRTRGMPPNTCPCEDVPNWPNRDIPAPRLPVSDRTKLRNICDRLGQMAQRADLYASTIVEEFSEYMQTDEAVDRLRHQSELILNSAGEGICGLDGQMNISFVNPAAAQMLGYEVKEAIGQLVHNILSPSNPNETPDAAIYATLQHGLVHYVTDAVFWRKNGTSFPVEYVSAPIRQKGEIVGVVLTFKDITERQEIERMKDEFISMVSHELRTPLTSIRGALGLLGSGMLINQPEKSQRMLEIAVKNSDRLLRLLNDILDIECMSSGHIKMVKQVCNVEDLMIQAGDTLQGMAEKAAIAISVEPLDAQLWADPDRLIQVLTNLLSNAIKFSRSGSIVWLSASLQPTHVLFQVKDRGRGIPANKLHTIFERFQQVDTSDSRAYGGTGLGLTICQKIVQQHGGRIWAESHLGQGSSFYFTVPILTEEDLG